MMCDQQFVVVQIHFGFLPFFPRKSEAVMCPVTKISQMNDLSLALIVAAIISTSRVRVKAHADRA